MRAIRMGIGFVMGVVAVAAIALAMPLSSASAEGYFCANHRVNDVQKCFGAALEMNEALGYGSETGICVGYDTVQGTCAPVGAEAIVTVSRGVHQPWVIGTGSELTYAYVSAGVDE